MRTGLFFGTFNPVHRGHEALVSSFMASGKLDNIWIILTPSPPHKHITTLASFKDRWNMLELTFPECSEWQLSDIEQRLSSPHYTIRTLEYLKKCYPDLLFFLCIGGDTLQTLSNWYDYEKISENAELLVAGRPGIPSSVPPELNSFSVHFCEHEIVNISSSQIRELFASGRIPGTDLLHPEVRRYILKHCLYRL